MTSGLATIIKARRLVRGMEQGDLAAAIGCDARSVLRWEAGDLPSARHMVGLRRALEMTTAEMDGLVADHLDAGVGRLRVEGVAVLCRLGLTLPDLLGQILALEERTMGIEDPAHTGTVAGLTDIFEALPDSWRVLTRGGSIAGIWNFLPLKPAAYASMRAGELAEGHVGLAEVLTLELPGKVDVCLSSLTVDRDLANPGALTLLLRSLFDVAGGLELRGIEIGRICVQAWTPAGLLLCDRLGFRHVGVVPAAGRAVPILEIGLPELRAHTAMAGFLGPGAGRLAPGKLNGRPN